MCLCVTCLGTGPCLGPLSHWGPLTASCLSSITQSSICPSFQSLCLWSVIILLPKSILRFSSCLLHYWAVLILILTAHLNLLLKSILLAGGRSAFSGILNTVHRLLCRGVWGIWNLISTTQLAELLHQSYSISNGFNGLYAIILLITRKFCFLTSLKWTVFLVACHCYLKMQNLLPMDTIAW